MKCLRSIKGAAYGLLIFFFAINNANASPLKFKVTLIGTHDIDWTYHLKENTGTGGYSSDLLQEGTEFIDYDSTKPVIMTFKNKPGVGLIGTVKGKGIAKYPTVRADITNSNIASYSCIGNCPAAPGDINSPVPALTTFGSGCGRSFDTANVKLTYEFGTFAVQPLRFSDLGGIPGGTSIPGGFDPSLYVLPIGVLLAQNCGPTFPPNNPAQDLIDYRYPFLLDSNSTLLPQKPSSAVDKKLKRLKIGKTLIVNFDFSITPNKTLLVDGSGYTYAGATGVSWKLKLKRIS